MNEPSEVGSICVCTLLHTAVTNPCRCHVCAFSHTHRFIEYLWPCRPSYMCGCILWSVYTRSCMYELRCYPKYSSLGEVPFTYTPPPIPCHCTSNHSSFASFGIVYVLVLRAFLKCPPPPPPPPPRLFLQASHLVWTYWGLLQAAYSALNYDFLRYYT